MSDDIKYFKVKYAFKPTWTLQQAAHLLLGHDPDNSNFEINADASNRVSTLFYWLKFMQNNGRLIKVDGVTLNKPPKFNVDRFFECMKAGKREYDEEIYATRKLIWGNTPAQQIGGRVTKIIYRHAAKLMWNKHPSLYISQVSTHLVALADKLNAKYGTLLKSHQAGEIAGFLKGDSPHDKGAPKKAAAEIDSIDWDYIIENM